MSADTGIYIAKFPDGYRVTEVVQCVENVDYFAPGTKERKEELGLYFDNSKVYLDLESAHKRAWEIYEEFNKDEEEFGMGCPIEYGISYIGEYESFEDDYMRKHIEQWSAS